MHLLIFGAALSPSTANYVLCKTAKDNHEDPTFSQGTINVVAKHFYMADVHNSVNDATTALPTYLECALNRGLSITLVLTTLV